MFSMKGPAKTLLTVVPPLRTVWVGFDSHCNFTHSSWWCAGVKIGTEGEGEGEGK